MSINDIGDKSLERRTSSYSSLTPLRKILGFSVKGSILSGYNFFFLPNTFKNYVFFLILLLHSSVHIFSCNYQSKHYFFRKRASTHVSKWLQFETNAFSLAIICFRVCCYYILHLRLNVKGFFLLEVFFFVVLKMHTI